MVGGTSKGQSLAGVTGGDERGRGRSLRGVQANVSQKLMILDEDSKHTWSDSYYIKALQDILIYCCPLLVAFPPCSYTCVFFKWVSINNLMLIKIPHHPVFDVERALNRLLPLLLLPPLLLPPPPPRRFRLPAAATQLKYPLHFTATAGARTEIMEWIDTRHCCSF